MTVSRTVVCLMGPTASGKTECAIRLHEQFPVDIVSVDSALVYRGMDVGTAKPDAETLARAPHRLIDIREPEERYSAGQFAADARREIDAILGAGRVPLLVGGTMLYFRALIDGIAEMPSADPAVREQLDAEADDRGWPAMHVGARPRRRGGGGANRAERPAAHSASARSVSSERQAALRLAARREACRRRLRRSCALRWSTPRVRPCTSESTSDSSP